MPQSFKALTKTLSINAALGLLATFMLPYAFLKIVHGRFYLDDNHIKQVAGGLDVQSAHQEGHNFKSAIQELNGKEVYCNQPHPVIGWIDICRQGSFWGFRSQTNKSKPTLTYRVLLVGGSVANYLEDELQLSKALSKSLSLINNNMKPEVFNAAIPGFKQPQQLAVINSLIASGWEFDAIVNISGNNEIAFPANHLHREGYNPLLPYAHPERSIMAAKMLYKPMDKCKNKTPWDWHPLRQIAKVNCYKDSLLGLEKEVQWQPYLELMKYKQDAPESKELAIERALMIWYTSSRSSHAIAKANNYDYLEVIQPSQYYKGSKNLSEWEMSNVTTDDSMQVVGDAYTRLELDKFQISRENILDARGIFKDTRESTYRDNCCHLNRTGNDLLANAIAERLISLKKSRP